MGSTSRHWYAKLLTSQYGGKEMAIWIFKCQEKERNMGQVHGQPGSFHFPLAPSSCASDAKEPNSPRDVPVQQCVILAQDEESVPGAS